MESEHQSQWYEADLKSELERIHSQLIAILPFNKGDKLCSLDLTAANTDLSPDLLTDTCSFSAYIEAIRNKQQAKYLIGGYNEDRTVYSRSSIFIDRNDPLKEPRTIHLGIDLWGEAGIPVFAPLPGIVHSYAFNDHFGDYGATIILSHQLRGMQFYTLYGHLSLKDLQRLCKGQFMPAGKLFAHIGSEEENGHWPPHLHMQLIKDIGGHEGDYPGVCRRSDRAEYLQNSPDPSLMIRFE